MARQTIKKASAGLCRIRRSPSSPRVSYFLLSCFAPRELVSPANMPCSSCVPWPMDRWFIFWGGGEDVARVLTRGGKIRNWNCRRLLGFLRFCIFLIGWNAGSWLHATSTQSVDASFADSSWPSACCICFLFCFH